MVLVSRPQEAPAKVTQATDKATAKNLKATNDVIHLFFDITRALKTLSAYNHAGERVEASKNLLSRVYQAGGESAYVSTGKDIWYTIMKNSKAQNLELVKSLTNALNSLKRLIEECSAQ